MASDIVPVKPPIVAPERGELTLVHPDTGEALSLADASISDLARWTEAVREWEWNARDAKKHVSAECHRRMDFEGCWTLRDEGYEVKGQGPGKVTFDAEALREDLQKLVQREVISQGAADKAVRPEITYKAMKSGISALEKLGGEVAEVIEAHRRPDESSRRLTISKAKGAGG